MTEDDYYMGEALYQARLSLEAGEVPALQEWRTKARPNQMRCPGRKSRK